MSGPSAKIIADSVSPDGVRLVTMQVTFHRFVLAEMNTHRTLSRNSASSRAIPLQKQIDRVYADPAIPVKWAAEQKGMQGGDEVPKESAEMADDVWRKASVEARGSAKKLGDLGIHKSIANRLLEPWMQHTAVITATAWENFFEQRCSPLAQPEIRAAADLMREAYGASEPEKIEEGYWHLPYVDLRDANVALGQTGGQEREANAILTKVSAARCARVSYLTQEGERDIEEDLRLYERLTTAKPAHWSPLEHVATPWAANRQDNSSPLWMPQPGGLMKRIPTEHLPRVGNLLGWRSLRTEVEATQGEVTFR